MRPSTYAPRSQGKQEKGRPDPSMAAVGAMLILVLLFPFLSACESNFSIG